MVLPFDYLDSMMWSIVASGIMFGVAAFRLPYNASSGTIEEKGKGLGKGLGLALGFSGFYLFITGLAISLQWPFSSSGGIYNVLFGGAATLGGLVVLSAAAALYFGHGLQATSYFALVAGIYLVVDAYSILIYSTDTVKITREPLFSALLYLAPAAVMILSVPATHIQNKYARWVFGVFAFIFAVAWLYFAYSTTTGHLKPA